MNVKNSYYYFQSALTNEECNSIISLGESKLSNLKELGESTVAVTAGDTHKGGQFAGEISFEDKTAEQLKTDINNTYIRDSEIAWLNEQWLYDRIVPFINEANEHAGWKYDIDYFENFQFTKYGINQFYGWHQDSQTDHFAKYKRYIPGITPLQNGKIPSSYVRDGNYVNKIRKLSVTINIAEPDNYEGGVLNFDYGPHSVGERYHMCEEIKPRGSIIVFPSYVHHQVTPVTKGTRYSLVLWALGKPFR
jgi:PKHD-type hydroxylase